MCGTPALLRFVILRCWQPRSLSVLPPYLMTRLSPGTLEPGSPALSLADRALLRLLQIYGALALLALALVPLRFLPAEDAVILWEYSRNLAERGAITFIAGGPRVEGATDFGWMVLVAGAIRCGVAPFWFSAAANTAALLLLGAVLLRLARRQVTAGGVLLVAGAAALFRQIFAAAFGFAVLENALLLALLVLLIERRRTAQAACTALLLCLLRPDGIVFAVPLLLYLLLQERGRRRAALLAICALFILPGLVYFAWRWHYFGELLPLPFLVKADFRRDFGILVGGSVRTSLVPLLFTLAAITPVLRAPALRRTNLQLAAALIAVPTLFFWCVRLDQNVGSRFFYYLPVAAAILLARTWPELGGRRVLAFRVAFGAWLVLLAAPLYRESLTFRYMQFGSVRSIAEALARLPHRGTMLTSEAGFVPFYSGWPAVDPWGLNTPEFAHRFFQAGDVGRSGADLIVTHPDLGDRCIAPVGSHISFSERSWPHMTANIVAGAQASGYALWLTPYGSEFYRRSKHWKGYGGVGAGDRECWFVRASSQLRPELEQVLREHGGVGQETSVVLEQGRR